MNYIHVDDHKHNELTAKFVSSWLISCFPSPHRKKVWFSQLNVIPLRHYTEGDNEMPNSSRKPKAKEQNTNTDWRGFVNVELTEEQWADVDKEVSDKKVMERLPHHLDYLLELGKVTFNYTNGSISCALTILEGAQKGFTVSSFSDNLVEALVATRCKVQFHLVDFEAIFNAGGNTKRRRG